MLLFILLFNYFIIYLYNFLFYSYFILFNLYTFFFYSRMNNFENELCTTVDAILDILGHKPQITRIQEPSQSPHCPVADVIQPQPTGYVTWQACSVMQPQSIGYIV